MTLGRGREAGAGRTPRPRRCGPRNCAEARLGGSRPARQLRRAAPPAPGPQPLRACGKGCSFAWRGRREASCPLGLTAPTRASRSQTGSAKRSFLHAPPEGLPGTAVRSWASKPLGRWNPSPAPEGTGPGRGVNGGGPGLVAPETAPDPRTLPRRLRASLRCAPAQVPCPISLPSRFLEVPRPLFCRVHASALRGELRARLPESSVQRSRQTAARCLSHELRERGRGLWSRDPACSPESPARASAAGLTHHR